MSQFVEVPAARLDTDILQGLLEEYASRDGTDYGERELSLEEKVVNLRCQLQAGDLLILYNLDIEQWDLVPRETAGKLLAD